MVDGSKGKWTKLVADFESSDLSQREFANERGVPLSNLRYLLYRLRKESRPLATETAERTQIKPPSRRARRRARVSCRSRW